MSIERRIMFGAIVVFALIIGIAVGRYGSGSRDRDAPTQARSKEPAATPRSLTPRPPAEPPAVSHSITVLEDRVAADPTDRKSWVELGNRLFDHGRNGESIVAYQKALELDPNDADVLTDQGVMYRRNRQFQEAIENFERARIVDPSHLNCLYNLGVVHFHDLKDHDGARAAWEEYVRIAPPGPKLDAIRGELKRLRNASPDGG